MEFQIKVLSDSEMVALGYPSGGTVSIAVALNENGEVCSIASVDRVRRGTMCDNCTGTCAQGGIVWTRPDSLGNTLFRQCYAAVVAANGYDPIYISHLDPITVLVADTYGPKVPKEGSVPERTKSAAEELSEVVAMATQIEEVLNNGGN